MCELTYPPDRWYVRILFTLENFWFWLIDERFRAYVRSPERMGEVLEAAGLVRASRRETLTWVLDPYRRGDAI